MKTLNPSEEELLKLLLIQAGKPNVVKPALQRLCSLLEGGVYFPDRPTIRQHVLPLLLNTNISVRRWATKAIAYLGLGDSIHQDYLLNAFSQETDQENRSWFMAAIGKLHPHLETTAVCDRAGIDFRKEYELAKRLYKKENVSLGSKYIDIEKDSNSTLTWLALLEGYGTNPEDIAHHKFQSSEIVRQLNKHPDPIIAEYSVWALWKNADHSYEDLLIHPDAFQSQPANVRKWIHRLFASKPENITANIDLFQQMTRDKSMKAREGAALGIATMRLKDLSKAVTDWISEEQEPSIRDVLYEHMATNSQDTPHFGQFVLEEYKKYGSGSVFRTKMLVSAAGTPLLNDLRAVEVRESRREQELATGQQFDLFAGEPPTMTQNFNITGPVGTFVAGDQKIKTDAFEQTFAFSGFDTSALSDLLDHVKTEVGEEESKQLIADINEVAKEKDPKAAKSLKERLTTLSDTVTAGTKAATAIDKLKDVLDGWLV